MNRNKVFDTYKNEIRNSLEKLAPISDEMWDYVSEHFYQIDLPKNSFLIRKGDAVDKMYYVCKGLMRIYYSKADGTEVNRGFVLGEGFFTNSLSFLTDTPSHYEVQALEDTYLLYFSKEILETLYEKYPVTNKIGRIFAERNFIAKERKENRLRLLSPEEHYLFLVDNHPQMIKRVPQYHIASYLGITPETLSRIRQRIKKK